MLIISSFYLIISVGKDNKNDNKINDNSPPTVDVQTKDTMGTTSKTTTIKASFSDDVNVTEALIFYKSASATQWNSASIMSGSFDILIPSNPVEDVYYYVTVNDLAGNGPIGSPSVDGSIFYTINVKKDVENLVHNVFIEEATGPWCSNCPAVVDILSDLYESDEYNFYYVSLIVDDPDDESTKAYQRVNNDYKLYGFPSVFIDGGYEVVMGGSESKSFYQDKIKKAMNRDTAKIDVDVTSELNEKGGEIETSVKLINYENTVYNGRLKVYLTQIESSSYDYAGRPYHYGFLDYIADDYIEVPAEGEIEFTESYSTKDLDVDNLMIFAVVFNSESAERFSNPADEENLFDAYFADNCDATVVVEGGNLPPYAGITNIEQWKLHIMGRPLFKTLFGNTILIGKTPIKVDASDDSSVKWVEFYVDDQLMANVSEAPYEYTIESIPATLKLKHTIKVIAYDDTGKASSPDTIEAVIIIFRDLVNII